MFSYFQYIPEILSKLFKSLLFFYVEKTLNTFSRKMCDKYTKNKCENRKHQTKKARFQFWFQLKISVLKLKSEKTNQKKIKN